GPAKVTVIRNCPSFSKDISEAWRARTPISPSAPVAIMNSTSPSNRLRSTLTTRSGYFICLPRLALLDGFALLARFLDGPDHVEGLLRQIVVLALEDFLETAHRVGPRYGPAFPAREALCDEVRLREKALDLSGS